MKLDPDFLVSQVSALRQRLPWTIRYEGNLGVMRFCTLRKQSHAMIVGASYSIFYDVLNVMRADFENAWSVTTAETREKIGKKASKHFQIYAHEVREFQGEDAIAFSAFVPPLQPNRNNDSEFLLINFLQKYIKLKDGGTITSVEILTELPPCSSCIHVLQEFLKKNKRTLLHLYHLSPERHPHRTSLHSRLSMTQVPSYAPLTRLRPSVLAVKALLDTQLA